MEPVVPVYVSLWSDDDPHLEGQVLELDGERAKASFPVSRRSSWYPIGTQVRLQFAMDGSARKATSKAWVQGWYLDGRAQVYELRFCEESQVQLEVLPMLSAAFNRREVYRAKPSVREPVFVNVRGSRRGQGVEANLLDFSVRGASIALDTEEGFGSDGMHVWIELAMPEEPPIELVCRVIHRQLLGSQVCYGLEFDAVATENFEAKSELLGRHVNATQTEELRRRAG